MSKSNYTLTDRAAKKNVIHKNKQPELNPSFQNSPPKGKIIPTDWLRLWNFED
jgi:hypothetical protein